MEQWEELDAFVQELELANEAWSKTVQALRQQVESFKTVTDAIDQYYRELSIEDALRAIGVRALGDAARLHTARLNFGLTRSAALIWFPIDDPRSDLSLAPPEAQYSVEVRIGPRYLLGVDRDRGGAGDQRLSILIAGAKQLVATLPTTPEKFRAALLTAFRSPGYSGPPREEAPPATQAARETGSEAEQPAEAGAAGQAEPAVSPATAASDQAEATVSTEPSDVDASAETTDEPQQPVPDSDVPIELPGA